MTNGEQIDALVSTVAYGGTHLFYTCVQVKYGTLKAG
jgi:hypothetical protein